MRHLSLNVCLVLLSALVAGTVQAKTCTATSRSSTIVWNDASYWDANGVPADGDDVRLCLGSGDSWFNVDMDGETTAQIASLAPVDGLLHEVGMSLINGTLALAANAVINGYPFRMVVKEGASLAPADGVVHLATAFNFQLSTSLAASLKWHVSNSARLCPVSDDALGTLDAFTPDAITLDGGVLRTNSGIQNPETLELSANRGITLTANGGRIFSGDADIALNAPISGPGDLILGGSKYVVHLRGVNTYQGATRFVVYEYAVPQTLSCECAGALPMGTTLVATNGVEGTLALNGLSQTVAGFDLARALTLAGPGTVRFGAGVAADETVELRNLLFSGSPRLVFDGAGTVESHVAADGATFELASGTLSLVTGAFGSTDLVFADGTGLNVGGDRSVLLNQISSAGDTPATVNVSGSFTYGADDGVLRTLGVVLDPASDVTLSGFVDVVDATGFSLADDCVLVRQNVPTSTGDQIIDNAKVFISSTRQTGTGDESLVITNGGRAVVYATDALSSAYRVTVGPDSVFELAGPGAQTFSGSVVGGGMVRLVGGMRTLSGDFSDVELDVRSGELDVPAGQTLTVASATGAIVKTGAGTLVFTGTPAANPPTLTVLAGEVRLDADAACVGATTVAEGARLVFDADNQILSGQTLAVFGTLDLNGHNVRVANFSNTLPSQNDERSITLPVIENTAADTTAKITAPSSATYFYGYVRENPGRIELQLAGGSGLFGPDGAAAVSKVNFVNTGALPYSLYQRLRFRFKAKDGATAPIGMAEILPTYQGLPLPPLCVLGADASSREVASDCQEEKLVDGRANTEWRVTTVGDVDVELKFADGLGRVDGYRLAFPGNAANCPASWEVWGFRYETTSWVKIDDMRSAPDSLPYAWSNGSYTTNYLFSSEGRFGSMFGTNTVVEFSGTVGKVGSPNLRVSTVEPLVTGPLTGTGAVRLEYGSAIAPWDLSDFAGSFVVTNSTSGLWESPGRVLISARDGLDVQRVNVPSAQNLVVGNAAKESVSLLLDDNSPATQFGILRDEQGPLGVVKRGTSTRALETEAAANTGATSVEAGTLRVQGVRTAKPITARYVRFTPTCVKGGEGYMDGYGYNWGAGELRLLNADGTVVQWPTGTTASAPYGGHSTATVACSVDGDPNTRFLVANENLSKTATELPPLTIDPKGSVAFAGYSWYTSKTGDASRTPVEWTLEVSDDGTTWKTVHTGAAAYSSSAGDSQARGPYFLVGASAASGTSGVATLPTDFLVDPGDARATFAPALKARYFRFRPFETYKPLANSTSYGWQLAEISLWSNGERLAWNGQATAAVNGSSINGNNNSKVANLVNDKLDEPSHGASTATLERCFVNRYPSCAVIDAGREIEFDAWSFTTSAGGGAEERTPTTFDFAVSTNAVDWQVVTAVAGHVPVTGAYKDQGPWSVGDVFALPGARNNRLGDASPVAIASGATLQIAADYEKFGTLSGAGTLDLDMGSTAEINACTSAASFSGAVTGGGTLVVSGTNAQDFADADLSGVANLELAGGTVTGSASLGGGDLALACTGGALWCELTDVGALTATGRPRIVLPADVVAQNGARITLVAAASIDPATQTAFRNAEIVAPEDVPSSWKVAVNASATEIKVTAAPAGMVIVVR